MLPLAKCQPPAPPGEPIGDRILPHSFRIKRNIEAGASSAVGIPVKQRLFWLAQMGSSACSCLMWWLRSSSPVADILGNFLLLIEFLAPEANLFGRQPLDVGIVELPRRVFSPAQRRLHGRTCGRGRFKHV